MTTDYRIQIVRDGKAIFDLPADADSVIETVRAFATVGALTDLAGEGNTEEQPAETPTQRRKYTKRKTTNVAKRQKSGTGCAECGSPSRHKKDCSRSGGARQGVGSRRIDQATADKIVELRKDGFSANKIEVEVGVSRPLVSQVIRDAGIIDTAGRPDERYPLRCARCNEKGHTASACTNGDALDALDRAEGYVESQSRSGAMSRMTFGRVKISQTHDIPAETVARNLDEPLAEIERAFDSDTYDDYAKS